MSAEGSGSGGVNAFAGPLTVGDNLLAGSIDGAAGPNSDVVQWRQSEQLPDFLAPITVQGTGLLDLNGNTETIGQANQQAALLAPGKDEPAAERLKRIVAYITDTENRSFAKPDEVEKVILRKSRNRYRDVIELYSDESDPMILDYVKRANDLLKKLTMASGE